VVRVPAKGKEIEFTGFETCKVRSQ